MNTVRLHLVLLLALVLRGDTHAQGLKYTPTEVTQRSGVIVLENGGRPVGSGFVFGPQNDVVTCWHVKHGAQSVLGATNLVLISGVTRHRLTPKYILPRYDLAVFSPLPEITNHFEAGDFKKLRPGDVICYAGWDSRTSTEFNLMTQLNVTLVTAVGSAFNDGVIVDFLEFEGVGIPGYSGGAVFTPDGKLVAIMREAWTKKGLTGGNEVLINRAFSVEILTVLNGQVFREELDSTPKTNRTQLGALEIISLTTNK